MLAPSNPRSVHPAFHGAFEVATVCCGMSQGADLTHAAGFLVENYDARGQRDREAKTASGGSHVPDGTWGVNERIRRLMAQRPKSEVEAAIRANGTYAERVTPRS